MTSNHTAAPAEDDTGAAPEPGLSALLGAAAKRLGGFHGYAIGQCPTDLIYHWREGSDVYQLFGSDLGFAITSTRAWSLLARVIDGDLPEETLAALKRVEGFAARYRTTHRGRPARPLSSIDGAELLMPDVEQLVILLKSVADVARLHWQKTREFPQNGDNAPPAPNGA